MDDLIESGETQLPHIKRNLLILHANRLTRGIIDFVIKNVLKEKRVFNILDGLR